MTGPNDETFAAVADDYLARRRAGDAVSADEYAAKYPALADLIRELFPALSALARVEHPTAAASARYHSCLASHRSRYPSSASIPQCSQYTVLPVAESSIVKSG